MAQPRRHLPRKARKPAVERRLVGLKGETAEAAAVKLDKILNRIRSGDISEERVISLERFLAKRRGVHKSFEQLVNESLVLLQNYSKERKGLSPTFALTAKEEASSLKKFRRLLKTLEDLERIGML